MLFVSGVFTPKGNLSSIDEYTIGSYQIDVFWWLIEFMFGVKIPKLAGWGGKKTGPKTMEREHAVITQMWDYCKQCEDIVIVSKTRKTFLDNFYTQNLRRSEKTIGRTFFPFCLLEQLLPLRGWGVSNAIKQVFLVKKRLWIANDLICFHFLDSFSSKRTRRCCDYAQTPSPWWNQFSRLMKVQQEFRNILCN